MEILTMKIPAANLFAIALVALGVVRASADAAIGDTFITLGTMGGPIPSAYRSQPANVLVRGANAYLIDAGDGAAQQLSKAGISLTNVKAIFLSHLHFDHTGGVAAVLGLRYQTNVPGAMTIYGPPGTRALIDGIVASMQPAAEAGYGLQGSTHVAPKDTVRVIEMTDGSKVTLAGFTVIAAQNSHYSFAPGSREDSRFKSLSFRFDLPDRSIVYTGDTGPSSSVERLARNADLLVSEMIDLEATVENIRRNNPSLPDGARADIVKHLTDHHLTPTQVGELASRADVRRLVITHVVPGKTSAADAERYLADVRKSFRGPVIVANDLDRF
jgi:ribonuclease BN (tRNA processing enzyme)